MFFVLCSLVHSLRQWRFQTRASQGIARVKFCLLLTETRLWYSAALPRMSPARVTWQLWNRQWSEGTVPVSISLGLFYAVSCEDVFVSVQIVIPNRQSIAVCRNRETGRWLVSQATPLKRFCRMLPPPPRPPLQPVSRRGDLCDRFCSEWSLN